MNILITDGENRSSLAATRSLGKKGHKVIISGQSLRNISSVSKYCAGRYKVSDPLESGNAYINDIKKILEKNEIDIVLPMAEATIRALLNTTESLPSRTRVASPSWGIMEKVFDKIKLLKIAQQNRVQTPLSVFFQNKEDFFSRQSSHFSFPFDFPVVIKPAMSKIPTEKGYVNGSVMYASCADELFSLYSREESLSYPSMIQEKIRGPGTALFALLDGKKPLALFSHRRLREKPPSGGVSVLCESIKLEDDIVDMSMRLLNVIGWTGVAMVEFKRDERDGRPKLMEINGRFWGSLQLAIDCGVDFPSLLVDCMQGRKPPKTIREYKVGHKLKWLIGTFDHMLIRMRNDADRLNLYPDFPSRLASLAVFFKIWEEETTFDVIEKHDMKPFFWEIREYIANLI